MKKLVNTHDELIRNFGQGSAPPNSFAGAAEGAAGAFSTFPVSDIGDTMEHPPFPDRSTEYLPPASRLPLQVTAQQSKQHNCTWQMQNPWDSETENAPILAGTRSGTPSATPVADDLPGEATGRAIAEGDPEGAVSNIAEGASNVVQGLGSMAALAIADAKGKIDPEGNSIEDAFSRLRRIGGSY
ncbi:MAG: hypothetical protein WCC37_05775 [Candidatus Sulfotelmatobacter sp.]|jgi:hypothetical protein